MTMLKAKIAGTKQDLTNWSNEVDFQAWDSGTDVENWP
jgi:hypothetical protein